MKAIATTIATATTQRRRHQPRTIIVTGGGSGIGRRIVQLLTARGDNVMTCGRRAAALHETVALCHSTRRMKDGTIATATTASTTAVEAPEAGIVVPGAVATCVTDLAIPGSEHELITQTLQHFGADCRIDGIVNNAAQTWPVLFPQWDDQALEHLLQINVRAPIRVIQAAWPYLTTQKKKKSVSNNNNNYNDNNNGCDDDNTDDDGGGGRIINMSSVAVLSPFPGNGAYGMTKSALDAVTRSIHAEQDQNSENSPFVKAFSIAPGAVETEMLRTLVTHEQVSTDHTMSTTDIATVVLACLDGQYDEHAGQVLYVPIPGGGVTTDPKKAQHLLEEYFASSSS